MWKRFHTGDKVGVSIIDRIPYSYTENALKRDKTLKMWIRLYDTVRVSIVDSIPQLYFLIKILF